MWCIERAMKSWERVVAIKLLAPGVFTGDEARRRFHKEALALAKLSLTRTSRPFTTLASRTGSTTS